jgi:hypothetical protein
VKQKCVKSSSVAVLLLLNIDTCRGRQHYSNDTCSSHSCWRQSCLQNLNTTLLVVKKKVIVCVLRLQARKEATQSENKSGKSIMLLLLLFLVRTNNFFLNKLQLTASTLFASYRIQKFRALNWVVFTLKNQCSTILTSMWTSLPSNLSLQVCDQILVCISYVSCVLNHSPFLFSFTL